MSHSAKWNAQRIQTQLVGGTIIRGIFDKGDGEYREDGFGMLIEFPDKSIKAVWILSDDEGNDCGGLDITNEN